MKSLIACITLLSAVQGGAQSVISNAGGGAVRLMGDDETVFELKEARTDLACSVAPLKPELGFDFLFHAGYRITIPLRELAGPENALAVVVRVTSDRRKEEPVYFLQKFKVPALAEDAKGNTVLDGGFRLGEGKYHVDWLMRDLEGRVCARFWDVDAKPSTGDLRLAQALPQDLIQASESTPFEQDSTVERQTAGRPLHVKVIINFSPQSLQATALSPDDLQGLAAILRKIGREPRIDSFSTVACSIKAQQVLYRQENAPRIDLPVLGRALQSLSFAKVDAKQLALKNGDTKFLTQLLTEESGEDRSDALILVSPKFYAEADVSREAIEHLKGLDAPVFYLNYSANRYSHPWRDAIGRVVKQLHGFEYTITQPKDLLNAWSDIVMRLVSGKHGMGSAVD